MDKEQKHYELTFIIPGTVSEDQHPEVLKKVKNLLEKNGASITAQEDMGRKKLAYPIKHVKHGFYYSLEFNYAVDLARDLEKTLRLDTQILRFLLINKHVKTAEETAAQDQVKEKRIKKKLAEQLKTEEEEEETKEKSKTKKKISLEDLDKKLDELLDSEIVK